MLAHEDLTDGLDKVISDMYQEIAVSCLVFRFSLEKVRSEKIKSKTVPNETPLTVYLRQCLISVLIVTLMR